MHQTEAEDLEIILITYLAIELRWQLRLLRCQDIGPQAVFFPPQNDKNNNPPTSSKINPGWTIRSYNSREHPLLADMGEGLAKQ